MLERPLTTDERALLLKAQRFAADGMPSLTGDEWERLAQLLEAEKAEREAIIDAAEAEAITVEIARHIADGHMEEQVGPRLCTLAEQQALAELVVTLVGRCKQVDTLAKQLESRHTGFKHIRRVLGNG